LLELFSEEFGSLINQLKIDKKTIHILSAKVTVTGKKIKAKTFETENFHHLSPNLKSNTHIKIKRGEKAIINHKITHLITKTIANATKGKNNIIATITLIIA
jgi:hypothetical protein